MDWTYGSSDQDVLGEDDSLGLYNKEVDELFNIIQSGLEGLLWDLVVASGTD